MEGGSSRLARIAAYGIAALAASALVGCGDDAPQKVTTTGKSPRRALLEVQRAFAQRDLKSMCVLLTRSAREEVGKTAHNSPTTCLRDLDRLIGMIDSIDGWDDSEPPRFVREVGDGTRREVTVRTDDGWEATLPFAKEAGKWRLAAFVGTTRAALDRAEKRMPEVSFPTAAGKPVVAATSGGTPCPPIRLARNLDSPPSALDYYPHAAGGCVVDVTSGGRLPVRMLTAFGDFRFDDCSLTFRLRVGPDGRTWTEKWQGGGRDEGGCQDLIDCVSPASAAVNPPWKGRLQMTGGDTFVLRTRMCLRTCVGFFVGDWVRTFERDGAGWRVDSVADGRTGFSIDGSLEAAGREGLSLREAPRRGAATGALSSVPTS